VSDDTEPIDDSITPLISTLTFGGRIFGRAMSRITIEGAIDQIPTEGPLILAANHASNLDAVVLGSWLIPRLGRRIHWLGKKELFAWPIIGWAAANGGVHPVDRGGADVEAFRLAQRILDEGNILFVFPEGTRSSDGSLQEARDVVEDQVEGVRSRSVLEVEQQVVGRAEVDVGLHGREHQLALCRGQMARDDGAVPR